MTSLAFERCDRFICREIHTFIKLLFMKVVSRARIDVLHHPGEGSILATNVHCLTNGNIMTKTGSDEPCILKYVE